MKIYTRGGDKGMTQILGEGSRVAKSDPRVHALGSLDELNANIGSVRAALDISGTVAHEEVDKRLSSVQHRLFDLGSCLTLGKKKDFGSWVKELETWIDEWETELPELKNFILPAGTEAVSRVHLARAVTRRAERWITEACDDWALPYLNRLSDMLFVLARRLTYEAGADEVIWRSNG